MNQPRPTAVTVFGILNIVFGAWGILGVILGQIITRVMNASGTATPNPVVEAMERNEVLRAWSQIGIPLGLIATTALIVSGIGLLKLRPWARLTAIVYACYSIVSQLAAAALFAIFVLPTVMRNVDSATSSKIIIISGVVGGVLGSTIGMVYPVVLLIFMYRWNVRQAFQRPSPSLPQEAPPQP